MPPQLSLGQVTDYTIDPNIPQNSQDSVNQINAQTNDQVALIQATTGGARKKYRYNKTKYRRKRRTYKGGDNGGDGKILVTPLPSGAMTNNTISNNIAMSKLYAGAVMDGENDQLVVTGGGKANTYKLRKNRRNKRTKRKQRTNKRTKKRRTKRSKRKTK